MWRTVRNTKFDSRITSVSDAKMATSRTTTFHRYCFTFFLFISVYFVKSAVLNGRDGPPNVAGGGKPSFSRRGEQILKKVMRPTVPQSDSDVVPLQGQQGKPYAAAGANENLRKANKNLKYESKNDDERVNTFLPKSADSAGIQFQQNRQNQEATKTNKPPPIKIADNPDCANDVKRLCSTKSSDNNFAILDCLQHDFKVCATLLLLGTGKKQTHRPYPQPFPLSWPHTARFYLRLSTMCHCAIKTDYLKNCSIEYRIIKPLTLAISCTILS